MAAASFSFYDSPSSNNSATSFTSKSQRASSEQDSLAVSPYPTIIEPSPVDSNGTTGSNNTGIDDDAEDESREQSKPSSKPSTRPSTRPSSNPPSEPTSATSPKSPESQVPFRSLSSRLCSKADNPLKLDKINTSIAEMSDQDPDTGPKSVIHAPQSFSEFVSQIDQVQNCRLTPKQKEPQTPSMNDELQHPSPSERSEQTVVSPTSPEALSPDFKKENATPLNTDIPQAPALDRPTPQAQTIQEAEEEWNARKIRSPSLENIPENQDHDTRKTSRKGSQQDVDKSHETHAATKAQEAQITALDAALNECWTLCNTLAGLSSNHRTRIFRYRGKADIQGQAWHSCWRLCQSLYDNRNEDHSALVQPTLELCREFCHALFEARQRSDEATDSVLRVSFELNNHLYNTNNRSLPSAFQERTLDFYLTLCHRLMKQRTSLPHETDALLRACWTLAELLFSMRQNKRELKPPDEELLGSAVQACWDLCDLFREGWTQVRPESRTTPRANQTTFNQSQTSFHTQSSYSNRSSPSMTRSSTSQSHHVPKLFPPETPTTIFDDTLDPLDISDDANIPNILVLGPDQSGSIYSNSTGGNPYRWSSATSNISGYSGDAGSTHRSTSTATNGRFSSSVDVINRLRELLLTAATNVGFQLSSRVTSPTSAASNSSHQRSQHLIQQNNALIAFVKNLPPNALGPQQWHTSLLSKYTKLVVAWPAVTKVAAKSGKNPTAPSSPGLLITPNTGRKVHPPEIAKAVQWMMQSQHYAWLRDLYRVVFGQDLDEAINGAAA
ncbi:MAG: hypothetical protein M1828_006547 [Chrysothrix sp. TS-e1954]|nr:MAG: hypothetical protein M1828_006547 [Chrysothrix sp. TS-e1954]